MSIVIDGGRPGDTPAVVLDGGDQSYTGSLGLDWWGVDGSHWDLNSGPVRASVAGIKGLGMPDVKFQVTENAGRDGQRMRDFRRNARTVFIPVRFKGAAGTDVMGVQRRFWRALGLGQYGTLVATTPDGVTRSLRCRFEDDGNYAYTLDPFTAFTTTIGLTLTADDPYWYGNRVTASYSLDPSTQVNFFGGGDPAATNSGPPFYLSASTGTQSYTVDNPGDVDAWPLWSIVGPAVSFQVGIGSRTIAGAITIPADRTLLIDTNPNAQTAVLVDTAAYQLDGTQANVARVRFQDFSAIDFAPVPRGTSVQLTMTINGSGAVGVAVDPRFERAF